MAKISIIIPIYNVEKYIRQCIESVIGQTMLDLQILVVNDGTKDKSAEICAEYAQKDERIQILHKENGGLSDARNFGMKHANGDYVMFIDSDDYIELDMVEYMYQNIVAYDVDMSTCGTYDVYANRIVSPKVLEGKVVSSAEAYSYMLREKVGMCNKLIKRSLIQDLAFCVGKTSEDVFFSYDLMQKVSTVFLGTEPKYYYVHRANSITTRPYSKHSYDVVEGYANTLQVVTKYFPSIYPEAQFRVFWSWFDLFDKIVMEPDYKKIPEYTEIHGNLRTHFVEIMKCPFFRKSRKIGALALMIHVSLYKILVLWNRKRNG